MRPEIALVVGTRPEAIKLAPVYRSVRDHPELCARVISTGQHAELLESALVPLGIAPDRQLSLMREGQSPFQLLHRVIEGVGSLLDDERPAALLVQGDTTTALAAALAAYYQGIPVGHVEAGLRTYDHQHPFPEEANRQLIARVATWNFAPTEASRANLLSERVDPKTIFVTGNTIIDALLWALDRSHYRCDPDTILITLHRRESFGEPLRNVLLGLDEFLAQHPEARALWPVHPNPQVARAIEAVPRISERVRLVEPLDYLSFAGALASCRFLLTDSGGLQEEAPSLGKLALVARETTERPEGLACGNRLVGRDRAQIRDALAEAWAEPAYEGVVPAPSPFGDGRAGEKIAAALAAALASVS